MELDTAADVSIASEVWVKDNLPANQILPTSNRLKYYNEKEIPTVGELFVKVKYNNYIHKLPFVIVKGDRPSLFGKKMALCNKVKLE